MSPDPNYQSYLLRLWRDNDHRPWRASLQNTVSTEKIVFADTHALFAFLVEQLQLDRNSDEYLLLVDWLREQRSETERK